VRFVVVPAAFVAAFVLTTLAVAATATFDASPEVLYICEYGTFHIVGPNNYQKNVYSTADPVSVEEKHYRGRNIAITCPNRGNFLGVQAIPVAALCQWRKDRGLEC